MSGATRDIYAYLGLALLPLLLSCSSVTTVSFDEPLPYVSLAAMEACATAGFAIGRDTPGAEQMSAGRGLIIGFFIGDGGETISVDLQSDGDATEVTIRSQKHLAGFFAQRHLDDRVAEFMATYITENAALEPQLSGDQGEQPMTREDLAKLALCLGVAAALSACSYHSVAFPLEGASTTTAVDAVTIEDGDPERPYTVVGKVHSHCRWNWIFAGGSCQDDTLRDALRKEAASLGADAVIDVTRTTFGKFEWGDVHLRGFAVRWQ